MPLYFAYGSNLKVERLEERVGEVGLAGIAALGGHRLSFAKRGKDGSGKACCEEAPGEQVWGALYELSDEQLSRLDAFEWGYSRAVVSVDREPDGASLAVTYRAEHFTDDPVPYEWYKQLLVEGAREHGMPSEWQTRLAAAPARPDARKPAADPA